MNIRILQNNYFNKSFKELLDRFLSTQIYPQKFKEINFAYLFNLPLITERNNKLEIKINEEIDKFKWDRYIISAIKERENQAILQLKESGYDSENISLTCSWRLIIGLGASHPQETSMTLHHIYGIPYIPGSAIKGVTRHWGVLKFAEELSKIDGRSFEKTVEEVSKALEEGKILKGLKVDNLAFDELIEIFGTQIQQGKVIFFDAYPTGDIKLTIDIMNPHYPKYYSGELPPTDWQNPVPIKFLTIENTEFKFYLAVRDASYKDLLEKAETFLSEALKEYGIGQRHH